MGLLDDIADDAADRQADADPPDRQGAEVATAVSATGRGSTVDIAGEQFDLAKPETTQPTEEGSWLTGGGQYGIPRGADAVENRQIVQTAAMQAIVTGITDQLLGGELTFVDNEGALEDLSEAELDAVANLKDVIRDVLTGPHLGDEDLDDLITAAVEEMCGPGNAYWQLLRPESGDLPVAGLTALDALTIRHNVDESGYPKDPPYWQATGAFSGGSIAAVGSVDPVPLEQSDLAVMRYPKGHRTWSRYPVSPAWQVKEFLEILTNSTTHHNRFYSDNEIPPGAIQVLGANDTTIQNIKSKLEEASGDPRDVPIFGGEGGAQWLDMGGTAINLDVIGEQEWFFELCLGTVGLGKAEVGMIEDVNRANGRIEASRVYKRVGGPFTKQFERAMLHICRQFDLFVELGEPFRPTLSYTDPREEQAEKEQLRQDAQAGLITPRQYARRTGNQDLAENDDRWTVEVDGREVNYGDHPRWVTERLFGVLGADVEETPGGDVDGEDDDGGE